MEETMARPFEQGLSNTRRNWLAGSLSGHWRRAGMLAIGFVMASALCLGTAAGPRQKKGKRDDKSNVLDIQTRLPMPEVKGFDVMISQMLGAWQVGDVDQMHKYYVDDLTMVSGAWEPPLLGWANYVRAYQSQRARV